jgi:hypothetical protein
MAPPKAERPGAELNRTGPLEDCHAGELDNFPNSEPQTKTQAPKPVGQLVDRYGHVHSEAVLTHWSPAALKALGIRRVTDKEGQQ